MDRNANNNGATEHENGHLSEDDLLLYADGELTRDQAANIHSHLEACWSCRARAEKYEGTIRSYIDYREIVQKPMDKAPPNGWRNFDRALEELVAASGRRSLLSLLRGWLAGLRPSPRSFSFSPQLAGRLAAMLAIAAIAVVALLIQSNRVTVVSASELLQRAASAHDQQLRATTQPIVYQKLQVKRKSSTASGESAATLEIWNDVNNSRFNQSVGDWSAVSTWVSNATPPRNQTPAQALLVDLENAFRANRLDVNEPLSANGYLAWRDSVGQKDEQVSKTTVANGEEALSLKTVVNEAKAVGAITEAGLVVRMKDWHPVSERIRVKASEGEVEYELTEIAFRVASPNTLDPSVFGAPAVASLSSGPTPALSPTSTRSEAVSSSPAPAASAELEVEVLERLNQVNALLGEQLSLTRASSGQLLVRGIVETEQRKREIEQALKSVSTNPAVRIEVNTVAEAQARQRQSPTRNVIVEEAQVAQQTIPVDTELRGYFSARGFSGDRLEQQIRQFSGEVSNRSSRARSHALALKQIAERFTPAQLSTLDQTARNRWRALLREHAQAYEREIQQLRRELQPIFPAASSSASAAESEIRTDEELIAAVNRLFKMAAANDRALGQSFSVSTDAVSKAAVKTLELWRSVAACESLATRIANSQ